MDEDPSDDARSLKPGPEPRHTERVTIYMDPIRKNCIQQLRMRKFQKNPKEKIPTEAQVGRDVLDAGLRALGFDPETGEEISTADD